MVENYSELTMIEFLTGELENVARSVSPFIVPELGNLGINGFYVTSDHSRTVA
jgi:hypothetical protein